MHIPDGLISPAISATGYALSLGVAIPIFLKARLLTSRMTRISLVAAVVFVSSLIHIPMGFTSVHFTFAPMAGILLGPSSFIAVSLAIFLQWLLLGHGGITTMGINTLTMGSSALIGCYLFYRLYNPLSAGKRYSAFPAVLAGVIAALTKVILGSTVLVLSGFPAETFFLVLLSHVPVILGEGAVAGLAAYYVLRLFRGTEIFAHA
ncbi:MAG: energy-coupling factor ABC transporter permease [Bacillota bacterium]